MRLRALFLLASTAASCVTPQVAAAPSLRGVSSRGEVAWASGSGGAIFRINERGGWQRLRAPADAEDLDFRDVEARPNGALLMAAGPGKASGLWHVDGQGRHAKKLLDCPWADGFFDGMAFWDEQRGLLVGDPVEGALMILRTEDGGRSWKHLKDAARAHAVPNEFAFAASGTSVCVLGSALAWIGTGGIGGGRVWRSENGGLAWTVVDTPLAQDREAAGIFSVAFADAMHGVIVGGDYLLPDAREWTAAWTEDGGRTWTLAQIPPGGYRSGAAALPDGSFVCTGPGGTDFSRDGGRSWQPMIGADGVRVPGFHAVSWPWLAGSDGRRMRLPR